MYGTFDQKRHQKRQFKSEGEDEPIRDAKQNFHLIYISPSVRSVQTSY